MNAIPLGLSLLVSLPVSFLHAADEPVVKPAQAKDAPGKASQPASEGELLFRKGEELFRKGQRAFEGKEPGIDPEPILREAIKVFEDLEKRFPKEEKTPQGVFFTGTSHFFLQDAAKALAAYQKVYDGYPNFSDRVNALFRIGISYSALEDPLQARWHFSKVIREHGKRIEEVKRAQKYIQELEIVGKPAPAFKTSNWLLGVVGTEGVKMFQGEVVIVFFFATWCPNCEKELPHTRALMEKYSPQGVIFLGAANPNDPMSSEGVEPYIKRNRLDYADIALDPNEDSWVPYRVFGYPAAVLIDRKGKVRWRGHPSFLMRPLIEKVIGER